VGLPSFEEGGDVVPKGSDVVMVAVATRWKVLSKLGVVGNHGGDDGVVDG
jgi:hypothetical protein|tara:strand:+ start:600 stop:749 length:150 start_codon:yes stop_codon:yes gene_type:complete